MVMIMTAHTQLLSTGPVLGSVTGVETEAQRDEEIFPMITQEMADQEPGSLAEANPNSWGAPIPV